MYHIEYRNADYDGEDWRRISPEPFETKGQAEIGIIELELEDAELGGYVFEYRIVEV